MAHDREFRLPDLGEGLTEAELVSWAVAPGDHVELNQTIAEVETAKALVELPSPFAGTVAELLFAPGDTVAVGAPIIRVTIEADDREPVLVGYGPEPAAQSRRRASRPATGLSVPAGGRPDAKPGARKLARELGIDLADVAPTGRAISVADVRAHDTDGVRETRTRATGVRKHTADAMTASARTIPQVTEFVTADVTATMDLVELLRPTITDAKLTPLTIVAKAALTMLAERPEVNSHWDDEGQEIVTPQYVNLGIAVAAPRGLLVPVVDDAHTMSMRELCRAIATAGERARSGHATPAELMGGTFTITNFGVFGVDAGTPLILPGQGAILGVGSIAKRPWVIGDDVVARWVTTLALTFDHRLIDGEQASAFLAGLAAMLTDPRLLLGRG